MHVVMGRKKGVMFSITYVYFIQNAQKMYINVYNINIILTAPFECTNNIVELFFFYPADIHWH